MCKRVLFNRKKEQLNIDNLPEKDYLVTLYLNQKITFDLLAIMEDGFSQFSVVESQKSKEESRESSVKSEIGVSNVFSLLGVTLSAGRGKSKTEQAKHSQVSEKIHTPTSLFSKLYTLLKEQGKITVISSTDDLIELSHGSFVEFSGGLKSNPLIEAFEGFSNFIDLIHAFTGAEINKGKKKDGDMIKIKGQIQSLLKALKGGDVIDLLCEIHGDDRIKAVLPVDINFFINKNMSEIVDGNYKVFGKVVKSVRKEGEINLLRNTSFSLLKKQFMDQLLDIFKSMENDYFELPTLETQIGPTCLLVIPIAIYT